MSEVNRNEERETDFKARDRVEEDLNGRVTVRLRLD